MFTRLRHHPTAVLLSLSCLLALTPNAGAADATLALIQGGAGLDNFDRVGDADWRATADDIEASAGSGASFLVTRERYGDFRLVVEFWASDDANSGIYMRCQDAQVITDRSCYEANIFDQRPDPSFGTGAVVHIAPVSDPRPMAGGRWNTYDITLRGDHLQVTLNGTQTVDARDSQFSAGVLALQWARGTIRFRKVELTPLQD